MESATTWLAIYGAALSSLVAGLQIYRYFMESKFVVVDVQRGVDLTSESIHFRISNRSAQSTQIQEIMISGFGAGDDGDFHVIWGSGVSFFKLARVGDDIEERAALDLPYSLQPGESVWVNFTSEDCQRQIEYFTTPPFGADDFQQSDLFEIEISHSRSPSSYRMNFEIDPEYIQAPLEAWRTMVPFWQRRRFDARSTPHGKD
jgi:hypothetical protein